MREQTCHSQQSGDPLSKVASLRHSTTNRPFPLLPVATASLTTPSQYLSGKKWLVQNSIVTRGTDPNLSQRELASVSKCCSFMETQRPTSWWRRSEYGQLIWWLQGLREESCLQGLRESNSIYLGCPSSVCNRWRDGPAASSLCRVTSSISWSSNSLSWPASSSWER